MGWAKGSLEARVRVPPETLESVAAHNTFASILTRSWGDNNVYDREVRASCRSGLGSGEETILGKSVNFDQGGNKYQSLTAIASSK